MAHLPLPDPATTAMFAEAAETPAVIARQAAANAAAIAALARKLGSMAPHIMFTCARGSSDHAASFAKTLFETRLGIPVVSQAPSISSIYGKPLLHMAGQPYLLISQSGRSPDLLLSAEAAKRAGALVIALVNDTGSPLAAIADVVLPLHAGPEQSVAATKSYVASLAACAQLAAAWAGDDALAAALARLPDDLMAAWDADWSAALGLLRPAASAYVLGRGLTLGVAQEAALKCKECCGLHGEAFSLAEVAHGPMALVGPDFPVLVLPPLDPARAGLDALVARLRDRGAPVAIAGSGGGNAGAVALPFDATLHAAAAPMAMALSFYRLANALALARGHDPDHPPALAKVTQTR